MVVKITPGTYPPGCIYIIASVDMPPAKPLLGRDYTSEISTIFHTDLGAGEYFTSESFTNQRLYWEIPAMFHTYLSAGEYCTSEISPMFYAHLHVSEHITSKISPS